MLRRLHVPLTKPEDIIPHLAKQEQHWRSGYSAQELVLSWSKARNGFPPEVRVVLDGSTEFKNAELVDGFFEREVDLGTPGRNSQTDLMVVAGIGGKLAIIAVEGKVDETFGSLVGEWNDKTEGKITRLNALCLTLGLDPLNVDDLRYQLLHRTASAVYEAKRYRSENALMLVHSFSSTRKWHSDFLAFANAMKVEITTQGMSSVKLCDDVKTQLAWASGI